MGQKVEGAELARPILLGFKFTADLELVLDRSWMLGQANNKTAKDINIVRDLTAKQRQREADMVTEASRKNLERSQEEFEQNIVYKIVGRKGEKREIKVTLRLGEELGDAGNVVRRDGWTRGNRRDLVRPLRTGGNSEPLGSSNAGSAGVGAAGDGGSNAGGGAAARPEEPPKQAAKTPKKKSPERKEVGGQGDRVRAFNKESGDWEWEPATGKRGRPSPSPDKVIKKVRGAGVLELKNRFQQMAEGLFKAEDRNLL